uniref:Uncharacterized protein n=1 Tax=Molossus molossus TaxID=27622 RepID=A0A7J8HCF5_MOLMO|nr:hypothetical protein HJG59_011132 [Molossus molossus]
MPRDPKSPPSTTQDSSQSPEQEFTEKPENRVAAKPVSKDHAPEHRSSPSQGPQAPGGQSRVKPEAKSDEKGVSSKKPVVGRQGKPAVGVEKQKQPLVRKKAAVTKKPAAEKKPTTEEKKPAP